MERISTLFTRKEPRPMSWQSLEGGEDRESRLMTALTRIERGYHFIGRVYLGRYNVPYPLREYLSVRQWETRARR